MKLIEKNIFKSLSLLLISVLLLSITEIYAKKYPAIEIHYRALQGNEGLLTVHGDVKAPREKVWDVLTRTDEKICTHTRDILKFSMEKTGEGTYLAYYLLDYPWPFEDKWQKLLIHHDKKHYSIYWERVEGSIRKNTGHYILEQHDEYTTIDYGVEFDPGLNYIPDALVHYAVRIQAPNILKNIRKCVR